MTVAIDEYGMLNIQAETELESYALNKWCDDNFSRSGCKSIDTNNITINVGFNKTTI